MTETETLDAPGTKTGTGTAETAGTAGTGTRTGTGPETGLGTGGGRHYRTETETDICGTGTGTTGTGTGQRRRRTRAMIVKYRPESESRSRRSRKTGTGTGVLADPASRGLIIVVAIMAGVGQYMYARQQHYVGMVVIGDFDLTPWLVVAAFDLAVASFLHAGMAAARRGVTPWPFWFVAGIVGGLSIFTNTQHAGGLIGPASSFALMALLGLSYYAEYVQLEIAKERRADAGPKLLTSKLLLIDRRLAYRAWVISSTKPLGARVAELKARGEKTSERDLAIRMAHLYLTLLDDRLQAELDPEGGKKVRFWQRRKRHLAAQRAEIVAGDTVDLELGLPVPDRTAIEIKLPTYVHQKQPTAVRTEAPTNVDREPNREPEREPERRHEDHQDNAESKRERRSEPTTKIDMSVDLSAIDGLPVIPADLMCECSATKPCGRTLAEHVARRLEFVQKVIANLPRWDQRVERVSKSDIKNICGSRGDGVQNEMAGLFDHLRALAQEQQPSPVNA